MLKMKKTITLKTGHNKMENKNTFTTAETAQQLGLSPMALRLRIANKKIIPPQKNLRGWHEWTPADIEAARQAMRGGK